MLFRKLLRKVYKHERPTKRAELAKEAFVETPSLNLAQTEEAGPENIIFGYIHDQGKKGIRI